MSLSNLFRELTQLWDTFTCVERLICPEGRVPSLNKSNQIQTMGLSACKMASLYRTNPCSCTALEIWRFLIHMINEERFWCLILKACFYPTNAAVTGIFQQYQGAWFNRMASINCGTNSRVASDLRSHHGSRVGSYVVIVKRYIILSVQEILAITLDYFTPLLAHLADISCFIG